MRCDNAWFGDVDGVCFSTGKLLHLRRCLPGDTLVARRHRSIGGWPVSHETRQSKIQNLDRFATRLVATDEDVSGLQIEMENAVLMRMIDPLGD